MKRMIIYGPPGTGKTTKLIDLMEQYVVDSKDPHRICFTSFTKKSVNEAIERMDKKYSLIKRELRFFRTIHSLALGLSGLQSRDLVQFQHKKELANILGLDLTYKKIDEDGTLGNHKDGDKMFHLSEYYRSKKISLRSAWEENDRPVDLRELIRFEKTYIKYKANNYLVDFTDILYQFLKEPLLTTFDVLFVDEAQDLSPIQWSVIYKIEKNSTVSYIAGDDDQCIYNWNGSDVNIFINLDGNKVTLNNSYRLNKNIHEFANKIISQVSTRVNKNYSSRNTYGIIKEITCLEDLELNKDKWLLLARNTYLLRQYENHCLDNGLLYSSPNSPTRWLEFKALVNWERFRKGEGLTQKEIDIINAFTTYKDICKKDWTNKNKPTWMEILNLISEQKIEYFRACRRNGEKLFSIPRIKINTIHGVKGSEEDNVCIISDMANTSWQAMQENPDAENRVFYTAVTRAKENLYILNPSTPKYFEFPIV